MILGQSDKISVLSSSAFDVWANFQVTRFKVSENYLFFFKFMLEAKLKTIVLKSRDFFTAKLNAASSNAFMFKGINCFVNYKTIDILI